MMSTERIHRAVSDDGTQIAGRVVGQGPPLVLVHGALYDGDSAWSQVLPHLTDRFSCFLPSTRGRGLSADGTDHAPQRILEDVVAFVESIGETVPLAGWSGGGMWSLAAAARSDAVAAVIGYEPGVLEAMDDALRAEFAATVGRMLEFTEQGQQLEAARAFTQLVATEEEQEAVLSSGRLLQAAPNVPVDLRTFVHITGAAVASPTSPDVLARITAPVLVLTGDRSRLPWFTASAHYLSQHLADCQLRTIPAVGHSAPGIAPELVAAEFASFLETQSQPA